MSAPKRKRRVAEAWPACERCGHLHDQTRPAPSSCPACGAKRPRTRSQNARRSRAKGGRGELAAVAMLRELWPAAKRCIAQSRTAAREGCDVEGTPYWIEAKTGARPAILAAMRQAMRDTDGRPPIVIARRDREGALVTMRAEDWIALARKALESEHASAVARPRRSRAAPGFVEGDWIDADGIPRDEILDDVEVIEEEP